MTTDKGGAPKGVKKSAEHKAKIAKAQEGKKNSNWVNGRRSYRKIAGAKEGTVVSHKDNNRNNNKKSNLIVLSDPPKKGNKLKGRLTTSAHEKHHAKHDSRGQGRPKGS